AGTCLRVALAELLCHRFHQETLITGGILPDFAFQLDPLTGFDIGGARKERQRSFGLVLGEAQSIVGHLRTTRDLTGAMSHEVNRSDTNCGRTDSDADGLTVPVAWGSWGVGP